MTELRILSAIPALFRWIATPKLDPVPEHLPVTRVLGPAASASDLAAVEEHLREVCRLTRKRVVLRLCVPFAGLALLTLVLAVGLGLVGVLL